MASRGRLLLACLLFLLSACLPPLCSGQCQNTGRFGEDCQHQCHCQDTCDPLTGICSASCVEDYVGPTCQNRNVARGKTATASSRYSRGWTWDKAVDGDTRQDVNTGTCFHSAEYSKPTSWSVDLGAVYPMDNIVIYYRAGYLNHFRTAQIIVSNSTTGGTLCGNGSTPTEESNDVLRYNCSSFGSHLILKQDGKCGACILEPCEVQIFACTAGFHGEHCNQSCSGGRYGEGCLSQCGHCDGDTLCRSTDGVCPQGCLPGWRGDTCQQVCTSESYGQNCTEECGHCSDGANCHHVTGSCLSGSCQPGYRGDRCDKRCRAGRYGQNCSAVCGQCREGDVCLHVNGSCPQGCLLGWTGVTCTDCQAGWYGNSCTPCGKCFNSTACDVINGACPEGLCDPGYRGVTCTEVCTAGTYGQTCTEQCGHCSDGANCHHVTGSCLSGSCQPGYRGDRCDQGVSKEMYDAAIQAAFDSGFSSGLGKGVGIGAGAVLGVVLLVAVVSLAVVCSRRRRRQQNGSSQPGVPPGSVSRPDPDQSTHYSTLAPVSGADNHYETLGMESLQAGAGSDVSKRK